MDIKKTEDFVRVSVRLKPVIHLNDENCLKVISKQPPVLLVTDKPQGYNFDNIFTHEFSQQDIYNETVKPLVEKVISGFDCTVFAYGQTGTGKTYTMGTNANVIKDEHVGLIPRTLEHFFNLTHENEEMQISVSFIEIYNEKAFDLLSQSNVQLQVKAFTVLGYQKVKIYNSYDALSLLRTGSTHRHTGETKQNINSSRSHAIFTIYYQRRLSDEEPESKLNLVDLAGSESVRKTGNQGNSFHEGVNINKGLLSLGQVMSALSDNSAHIPYRQSIITTILHNSLNKKNFISLIACVSASNDDLGETLQTLEFAYRVKKIKNKPEVNQIISQYKKENPLLFGRSSKGLTPTKRSNGNTYETPYKRAKIFTPLPMLHESVSVNNFNFDSFKSSTSSSIQKITNDTLPQNLSPVVKKCVNVIEECLMNKLKVVITDTLNRPTRFTLEEEKGKNVLTPSFSWNKLSQVFRSEIQQFGSSLVVTSTPMEKAKKLLTYDSLETSPIADDVMFKVPKPKKIIKKKTLKSPIKKRRSLRLELKAARDAIVPLDSTDRKSSVRLQLKTGNSKNLNASVANSQLNTSQRSKEKIPKVGSSPGRRVTRNFANLDKRKAIIEHTKTVLDILNTGSIKDVQKLHTIGAKTAEKILLFRKLKGSLSNIRDLAALPMSQIKLEKFLQENFCIQEL